MEKVISITGKEYAYRDEEPIKGRNTAPVRREISQITKWEKMKKLVF